MVADKVGLAEFSTLLNQIADTTYGMAAADYARFLVRLGFEPLIDDAVGSERFHVYGREEGGIVVTYDTFHRQRNCASLQFRTSAPLYLLPPDCVIEDIVRIDKKTSHVRLDARKDMLQCLAFFEQAYGFIDFWGNRDTHSDICGLTLEQDAAVALREGISPRDIGARMAEVSRRRCEMLPTLWKQRLDVEGARSSTDALALTSYSRLRKPSP
jgi:hypothetical protein